MNGKQADVSWSRQENDALAVIIFLVMIVAIGSVDLPNGWPAHVYLPAMGVPVMIILGLGYWLVYYIGIGRRS